MERGETALYARMGHEIPKPKDYQSFQRGCVILFKEELKDPTLDEFGRSGQNQGGIDLLGRRNNDPDQMVGIQCRLITRPDPLKKMLTDCRAATALGFDLKEIIFATTAPRDTNATQTALESERRLRSEGYLLKVTVYGWESLQDLIAQHPDAYRYFFPGSTATYAPLRHPSERPEADEIAASVVTQLKSLGLVGVFQGAAGDDLSIEDPRLHARIDTYRNLFKDDGEAVAAERRLLEILEKEDLSSRPWARYRIQALLGAIAVNAGREAEAADRFEAAYALRPDDPEAKARLALARTIRGRFTEAMDLAREQLAREKPSEFVVGFYLQAAARSGWQGNPEDLIPDALSGTPAADLGLAEFLRLRDAEGWALRSLELAAKHPDVPEFRRVRGFATLAFLVSNEAVIPGVKAPLGSADIQRGADDLKAVAEHCLAISYAPGHDLMAHFANAGAMLRLAGRYAECEALLRRGIERLPQDPHMRRQLALAQSAQNKREEALRTLGQDTDPENILLIAELTSADDPRKALDAANRLKPEDLAPDLRRTWGRIVGDLALRVDDETALEAAVANLRSVRPGDIYADLFEIASDARRGADEDDVKARLHVLASTFPADATSIDRYLVAARLRQHDLPEEAAALLEPYIDPVRGGPAVGLYLQCLSASRRDAKFQQTIESIPESEKDIDVLWTTAVHAWNIGDLSLAKKTTGEILKADPDNAQAVYLGIEICLRQDRLVDLLAELEKPIEAFDDLSLRERCRIASLLAHFGHVERGASAGYRLYLENRGESQAWMCLAGIVLDAGRTDGRAPRAWAMPQVEKNAAVDIRFDDGATEFCIVEPDPSLRRLDSQAWEPDHTLIRTVMGLASGDRFIDAAGRRGVVAQVRHKFVARFHQILDQHEKRFPEINGFRKIDVDPSRFDGLASVNRQLQERSDWYDDEQRAYLNGPWPLGVLATRLGVDTIEVAGSLIAAGQVLKVSSGGNDERIAADRAIAANARRGCVMDVLCFWTAWELKALDAVIATCGPVHLPQKVVDCLRARRDKIVAALSDGLRSATLVDGRLVITEAAPELVQAWLDDVDQALAWIENHVSINPVIIDDRIHTTLRDYVRLDRGEVFDALIVAHHLDLVLLTDDAPTRDLATSLGLRAGAWLYQVLTVAHASGKIDAAAWVRWSAALIRGGHHYVGVSGPALATAAALDALSGASPGPLFQTLARCLGGRIAEPVSHVQAAVGCLRIIWTSSAARNYREQVTSSLMRHVTRERSDYPLILRMIVNATLGLPQLTKYLERWMRGHFLRAE